MTGFLRRTLTRCGGLAIGGLMACSPASVVNVTPPSTVVDPSTVANATGAVQLYRFAVTYFDQRLATDNSTGSGSVVGASGVLTDELQSAIGSDVIDARIASSPFGLTRSTPMASIYTGLHQPRTAAQQAREALRLYAPSSPRAWQGQLYALEGYVLVYFAELFCSGIPVTTVPLTGTPQLTAGLSTQDLLTRAVALFDSAITVGVDTVRFVNLAKVGKGRALLDLGQFANAAAAVQGVPSDFAYSTVLSATVGGANILGNNPVLLLYSLADNEGGNGLLWSTDPRTATASIPRGTSTVKASAKYSLTTTGTLNPTIAAPATPIRVADGLEARLIEAEADLAANGTAWLTTLNTLRSTCVGGTTCAPLPPSTNLPFPLTAGSLVPLTDPGTPGARLDLLMKERAMWLYVTGHREGDLRRLAHVYQRDPGTLWPTGTYSNPTSQLNTSAYGTDVLLVPPANEAQNNPLYSGCVNTNP